MKQEYRPVGWNKIKPDDIIKYDLGIITSIPLTVVHIGKTHMYTKEKGLLKRFDGYRWVRLEEIDTYYVQDACANCKYSVYDSNTDTYDCSKRHYSLVAENGMCDEYKKETE